MGRLIGLILIGLLIFSLVPLEAAGEINKMKMEKHEGLTMISNGVITVAIPTVKAFPMYFWWYNEDNDTIYSGKYFAIAEAWIPPMSNFSRGHLFGRGAIAKLILNKLVEEGFGAEANISIMVENITVDLQEQVRRGDITTAINSVEDAIEKLQMYTEEDAIYNLLDALITLRDLLYTIRDEGLNQVNMGLLMHAIKELKSALMEFRARMGHKISQFMEIKTGIMRGNYHPFLLPFAALEWKLSGPTNITDTEGNVIGISFSFIAEEAHAKVFDYFDKIEIRNRIYTVNVEEIVNGENITITRAELKNDIIIEGWRWNMDILKKALGEYSGIIDEYFEPTLTVISHFTVLDKINESLVEFSYIGEPMEIEHMNVEMSVMKGFRGTIKVKDMEFTSEMEYESGFDDKLEILTEEGVVAGFYKFIPVANLHYPNGSIDEVEVKGIFWITNNHLWIFLVYPYFDNATLQHDPSIGVSLTQIEDEEPQYKVEVSDDQVQVSGLIEIEKKQREFQYTREMLMIIAALIIIAVIVAMSIFRRK
jgi:hypothetical protein